ncbi:DUF1016 family protein [Candidatus Woesearchaeota archaeon]|nr:DUF1016 family protein [Candidatus Woesearchaeota archaeon]
MPNISKYGKFLKEIKERIQKAQYEALKSVNKELINLYWDLGMMIVEKQMNQGWGRGIIKTLAKDLQREYPGIRGFSAQNLWYMRQFYMHYKDNAKLQPLVGEISWAKNIIILGGCEDDSQREFYIRMTKKFGWTKNVLLNQLENRAYEKYLLNQTNFDKTLPEKYKAQAKLAVKDEYIFDFLELGEQHSERELERSLTDQIRGFLTEIGNYFCFIGSQFRLEVGGQEYLVDLLLYHRELRCLIAVELKICEFKPEYAGKMQFYLSALDDTVKLDHENPSIGMIICKSKNKTIVEYALKDTKKPIGIASYRLSRELPERLSKYLPSEKDIGRGLNGHH